MTHSVPTRRSSDLQRLIAAGRDVAAHRFVDLDRLEHADAALEAGLAALVAPPGLPDDGADVEAEPRGDAVIRLHRLAAMAAELAAPPLRQHRAKARGEQERFDLQLLEPLDGATGIVVAGGREDEVADQRRLHGGH